MHFQLRYVTADFDFGAATISIRDDLGAITFLLRKRLAQDAPPPPEAGDGLVAVTCQREVPESLTQEATAGRPVTTATEIVAKTYRDLQDHLARMLRLVRWRGNYNGKPNPLRMPPDLSWSFDGAQWQPVARIAVRLKVTFGSPITPWSPEAEEFVRKESLGGLDEPLAHEMLREAWANRAQNPRSSVVLAIAAAEVGFKQFASKASSDGGWNLSRNLLSAHLLKMLTKFPWSELRLRINGKVPAVPNSITAKLDEGVRLRNMIVHEGVPKLESEAVDSMLTAVRDLLYLLDALRIRQSWPTTHLSHDVRKELA